MTKADLHTILLATWDLLVTRPKWIVKTFEKISQKPKKGMKKRASRFSTICAT
jgi:hypothetical protein